MPPHPSVDPERVTATYAIAIWQRLVLWVVDGQTPADELERLRLLVRKWGAERGEGKNVSLVVLHPARSTMTAEERRPVRQMIDETKHDRLASATVVLAEGIIGALHRSILTAFSLVVPPPHPNKIFARVRPAVEYLHPHIEQVCGPVTVDDVVAMTDELHAEILRARGT